ncbi:hypothetical protein Cantr_05120 [Candida viswanathii]|uniref:Uncharacterized protein n=1 Tax=Candida viswanathii TaxID=5486 RepID=A0A367XR52_9ASCO|nr:hypothetical protein Cantr_05120 [Candida viswanathii]
MKAFTNKRKLANVDAPDAKLHNRSQTGFSRIFLTTTHQKLLPVGNNNNNNNKPQKEKEKKTQTIGEFHLDGIVSCM